MNLSKRIAVKRLWPKPSTDGGGRAVSTAINVTGWEGCMLLFSQGDTDATGTTGGYIVRFSSAAGTTVNAYTVTASSACKWGTTGESVHVVDIPKFYDTAGKRNWMTVKGAMSSGYLRGWAFLYGGRRQGSTEAIVSGHVDTIVTIVPASSAAAK